MKDADTTGEEKCVRKIKKETVILRGGKDNGKRATHFLTVIG